MYCLSSLIIYLNDTDAVAIQPQFLQVYQMVQARNTRYLVTI